MFWNSWYLSTLNAEKLKEEAKEASVLLEDSEASVPLEDSEASVPLEDSEEGE